LLWFLAVQQKQDLWIPVVKGRVGCLQDEWSSARLYHAGMMLAGFPMEHVPVGKEIKPLLSPTSVLGGER